MSMPARVIHQRRATITALPLYYCGPLLKKYSDEEDFKKFYAELRGTTLFLYKDDTQYTYIEKLELEHLKSMILLSPYQRKTPTIFTLVTTKSEVQLKMDNPDSGEEWRGYILTMIKKKIPSKLQLLPGQMLLLKEALDQELMRTTPSAAPPRGTPDPGCPEMLPCFFNVTRQEAEQMLEANPEYGSIILRPSRLTNTYAVTLRQLTARGPVMGNFRLTTSNSGYIIELETPVTVSNLSDVLQYFLEKTEYRLHPYTPSQPYNTCIGEKGSQSPTEVSRHTTSNYGYVFNRGVSPSKVHDLSNAKTKGGRGAQCAFTAQNGTSAPKNQAT
ncbi:signal-transducing adaptor protein 1-like [Aulostomus maculatus]